VIGCSSCVDSNAASDEAPRYVRRVRLNLAFIGWCNSETLVPTTRRPCHGIRAPHSSTNAARPFLPWVLDALSKSQRASVLPYSPKKEEVCMQFIDGRGQDGCSLRELRRHCASHGIEDPELHLRHLIASNKVAYFLPPSLMPSSNSGLRVPRIVACSFHDSQQTSSLPAGVAIDVGSATRGDGSADGGDFVAQALGTQRSLYKALQVSILALVKKCPGMSTATIASHMRCVRLRNNCFTTTLTDLIVFTLAAEL